MTLWAAYGDGMRIPVEVEEIDLEGDFGPVPSVKVTCSECGESVEVYGTSGRSIRRGCIMLREACNEKNYYVYEGDELD